MAYVHIVLSQILTHKIRNKKCEEQKHLKSYVEFSTAINTHCYSREDSSFKSNKFPMCTNLTISLTHKQTTTHTRSQIQRHIQPNECKLVPSMRVQMNVAMFNIWTILSAHKCRCRRRKRATLNEKKNISHQNMYTLINTRLGINTHTYTAKARKNPNSFLSSYWRNFFFIRHFNLLCCQFLVIFQYMEFHEAHFYFQFLWNKHGTNIVNFNA